MLRLFVTTLVASLGLTGAAFAAPTVRSSMILVHSFQTKSGLSLVVWRPQPASLAVAFQKDPTDVAVIAGTTLTYWEEGHPTQRVRYHFAGIERVLRVRFGTDLAELEQGLEAGQLVPIDSPLVSSAPDPLKTFLSIDDFGQHVAALAKAAPFGFRYAGRSVLGLRLATSQLVRSSGDLGDATVTIFYSSNPRVLGTTDRQLVLIWGTSHSSAGSSYSSFLKRRLPVIRESGIVAKVVDPIDIVFRVGGVLCGVHSGTAMTTAAWRTLLRSLQSPSA